MCPTFRPNLELEAQLIKIDFQNMLVRWSQDTPPRTGLHASSVLVSDDEWCVREHVLMEFFSKQAVHAEAQPWDWRKQAIFEDGWRRHQRWQELFYRHGKVVYGNTNNDQSETATVAPELDLTHYDETREVYFSPDAILEFGGQRYVVEIKGIGNAAFEELTNDLEIACTVSQTVAKARMQANLYMHLLELRKAILLIENKNTQEFKVWIIEYDRAASVKYIQRIYDRKEAVILVRTHGLVKLPARIPACQSRGDERVRRCPMRNVCFSEELEV